MSFVNKTPFKKINKQKQQQSAISFNNQLNYLLGNETLKQLNKKQQSSLINRQFILQSAMFWDSKKQIGKIKSLILSNLKLKSFQDSQNFKIDELTSIELLNLSKNSIIHLQPLSVLEFLVCLNVNNNKIYDLHPLKNCIRLEELYANYNQITDIESLSQLQNLKILKFYHNSIKNEKTTFSVIYNLKKLKELDIEQNPVNQLEFRDKIILTSLKKYNGELIHKNEKQKLFGNQSTNNLSLFSMNNSSLTFNSAQNNHEGFSSNTTDLQEEFGRLEEEYTEIDDKFQEQIVKNVELKSQYHYILSNINKQKFKQQQINYQDEQIKLLRRKVRTLKENLFINTPKAELLKRIYELQLRQKRGKNKSQDIRINKVPSKIWQREFDYDERIIIEQNNQKYLQEEDEEIEQLLNSNQSTLKQLRQQLKQIL